MVSASHRPRPRIGSLDRMTGTSTRGSSSRSFGDCALTVPLGLEPPFPCRTLGDPPIPASAGFGYRPGPCAAGPPTGGSSWDASPRRRRPASPSGDKGRNCLVGGWCLPTPSASRHGDPGPPSGFGRTVDRDLRSATPGPASAVPPVAPDRSFAAPGPISVVPSTAFGTPSCCPTVRPRPVPRPQRKRPSALVRPGFGR